MIQCHSGKHLGPMPRPTNWANKAFILSQQAPTKRNTIFAAQSASPFSIAAF